MKYIRQLDSTRAIAVLLVMIHHSPLEIFLPKLHLGPWGVNTFFVLSGFLISRILLENRNEAEMLRTPAVSVFKSFFFRRALRIFPIYYLVIFLLYISYQYADTGKFGYFATYTANFYFFQKGSWDGIYSHLWSLSVEEQFYLIWPWLMLLLNKKMLLPVILLFISTGIATQYFFPGEMGQVLTFCCFDSLGFGALLAWVIVYRKDLLQKVYKVLLITAPVAFVVFIIQTNLEVWLIPLRTLTSIVALWLVCFILYKHERKQTMPAFLSSTGLVFLGKISYGLYLYHRIIPGYSGIILTPLNKALHVSEGLNMTFLVIENLILIIFISWLSWIIIEKPVLQLKKYFDYQKEGKSLAGNALSPVVVEK